ncbi:hypothetical protein FRB95_002830 [Tulasnella sp. JGI-2019a]|nr:hypothetical protein FRB95_002830 [Tulasnella sp. JGI-2019a]
MDIKDFPPHYEQGNVDLKAPFTDVQRLSMEDEHRPLPEGWIRQLDPSSAHHFYVSLSPNTRGINHQKTSSYLHPVAGRHYRDTPAKYLGTSLRRSSMATGATWPFSLP